MRNIFVLIWITLFTFSCAFAFASNIDLHPIHSIYDGKISSVAKQSITIKHQNTMDYKYQNIDKIIVTKGKKIIKGSVIGYVRNIEDLQVIATNGITEGIVYQNGAFVNDSEHHTE